MSENKENRKEQELTNEELNEASGGLHRREHGLPRMGIPFPREKKGPVKEHKDGGATGSW